MQSPRNPQPADLSVVESAYKMFQKSLCCGRELQGVVRREAWQSLLKINNNCKAPYKIDALLNRYYYTTSAEGNSCTKSCLHSLYDLEFGSAVSAQQVTSRLPARRKRYDRRHPLKQCDAAGGNRHCRGLCHGSSAGPREVYQSRLFFFFFFLYTFFFSHGFTHISKQFRWG